MLFLVFLCLLLVSVPCTDRQIVTIPDWDEVWELENSESCDMCSMGEIVNSSCVCWVGFTTNNSVNGHPPFATCGNDASTCGSAHPDSCYMYCTAANSVGPIIVQSSLWSVICPFANQFGSLSPFVAALRNFRDVTLMKNQFGRKLVLIYYKVNAMYPNFSSFMVKLVFKPWAVVYEWSHQE